MDIIAPLNLLRKAKVHVYVFGTLHYVCSISIIEDAFTVSMNNAKLRQEKRRENGRKTALKRKIERKSLSEILALGENVTPAEFSRICKEMVEREGLDEELIPFR